MLERTEKRKEKAKRRERGAAVHLSPQAQVGLGKKTFVSRLAEYNRLIMLSIYGTNQLDRYSEMNYHSL